MWDENGQPTTGLKAFNRTIASIRACSDIVIEGSIGGVNELSPQERSVSLQAEIEMASLNPGYAARIISKQRSICHETRTFRDGRADGPPV
ncbi:MAG: 3-keto-5-aminohexanoate cleavage protein [Anaerolineae bacterium]|nr:3-keto-5-aminohexanoate cleavage protein [Anaerolineae bacterium]